jgi:N-alpha-acetyltransferase 30
VTLEAEVPNKDAFALYGRLGFIGAKRLYRYYVNDVGAFRLKLLLPRSDPGLPPMMLGSDRDE